MKTRLAILAVAGLVGCAQPAVRPQKDMSAFNAAAPRSMPRMNTASTTASICVSRAIRARIRCGATRMPR